MDRKIVKKLWGNLRSSVSLFAEAYKQPLTDDLNPGGRPAIITFPIRMAIARNLEDVDNGKYR